MVHRLPAVVLLGLGALLAPAEAASTGSEAKLCLDLQAEPPLRVEACSRVLSAPDLTQKQRLDLLAARAQAFDDLGDYTRAVADYDSAIVLSPRNPVLRLNRGVAKIHGGRPADAIADYDEAARLKPDWHLPYFDRAVALTDLGQRAAALKDYDRAIQLKPDDAWIYVGQGDVLAASGDPARALAAYDKALALRPDLDDPRAKRAATLLRLDRPADALPDLDRVLAMNPSKPRLWQSRGKARFELADYIGAAADFGRALTLAPQDKDVRRDLTRAELGMGDAESAWDTLSSTIGSDGGEAADLTLAAMVALLTNRASAAESLVRRAVDIQPGGATAQMVLALHLLHQGDPDAAREAAALAVSFAPDDAEIAAVAKLAGAETDPDETPPPPPLPRVTPAQIAVADCVAALASGDLAAARAAPAGWSLCHLAAAMTQ